MYASNSYKYPKYLYVIPSTYYLRTYEKMLKAVTFDAVITTVLARRNEIILD